MLSVNGQSVADFSHEQVTELIKNTKTRGVWLSVCESETEFFDGGSLGSSLGSTSLRPGNIYASTPVLSRHHDMNSSSSNLFNSLSKRQPAHMASTTVFRNTSPQKIVPGPYATISPLSRKQAPQNDPAYVALVPPPTYTRLLVTLLYCGPVHIPESWSERGVSSKCIQECARQLLSCRKSQDFLKVQFDVSQSSFKIVNLTGNILVKNRRSELYYCGICTSDEQIFAIVTRKKKDAKNGGGVEELCHVLKLLPESTLSLYCIDRSKSQREIRAGPPEKVKSCVNITNAIQNIFLNEGPLSSVKRLEVTSSDGVDYGVVRGVSMLQMSGVDALYSSSPLQSSPLLKRKELSVLDLRLKNESRAKSKRERNMSNPQPMLGPQVSLSSSLIASRPCQNGDGPVHIRMSSDGSSSSNQSGNSALLRSTRPIPIPQRANIIQYDKAKRISDSSLSSLSSEHSGQRSGSCSPSKSHSGHSPSHSPTLPILTHEVNSHGLSRSRKSSFQGRAGSPTFGPKLHRRQVHGKREGESESKQCLCVGKVFQVCVCTVACFSCEM